jgi:hypothetical protein
MQYPPLTRFLSRCRLQATNNGATATADKPKGSEPVPVVKIDNLNDPFATVVSAAALGRNQLGLPPAQALAKACAALFIHIMVG